MRRAVPGPSGGSSCGKRVDRAEKGERIGLDVNLEKNITIGG